MSTTDSLNNGTKNSQETNQQNPDIPEDLNEEIKEKLSEAESSVKEELEREAGTTRLTRLVGIDSLYRNMQAEDQAFQNDLSGYQQSEFPDTEFPEGEDSMQRYLAGGNINIFQGMAEDQQPSNTSPIQPPTVTPSQPQSPANTSSPSNTSMSPLQKGLAALALASLGGVGGAALTNYFSTDPSPPPSLQDTSLDISHGVRSAPIE